MDADADAVTHDTAGEQFEALKMIRRAVAGGRASSHSSAQMQVDNIGEPLGNGRIVAQRLRNGRNRGFDRSQTALDEPRRRGECARRSGRSEKRRVGTRGSSQGRYGGGP